MEGTQEQLLTDIESKKALDDDLRKRLTGAINEYKQDFKAKLEEKKKDQEKNKDQGRNKDQDKRKDQKEDQAKQTAEAAA
jgi:F-type H+-transporting ATPase subunit alpha